MRTRASLFLLLDVACARTCVCVCIYLRSTLARVSSSVMLCFLSMLRLCELMCVVLLVCLVRECAHTSGFSAASMLARISSSVMLCFFSMLRLCELMRVVLLVCSV